MTSIFSWNVNGIRACINKGFFNWLRIADPDIICLQEVKISQEKLVEGLLKPSGYHTYWNCSDVKKGYSGVAVFTKKEPLRVIKDIGIEKFDQEGRMLMLEFNDFSLINAYFPQAGRDLGRLGFKIEFNNAYSDFVNNLMKDSKNIVLTGDFNVAHKDIDLANPGLNHNNAGFTLEERNWIDSFIGKSFVDTFREFEKEGGHYTWWSYMFNARKKNIGWRLDYFLVSKLFSSKVNNSFILKDVQGSDHCPIGVDLNV